MGIRSEEDTAMQRYVIIAAAVLLSTGAANADVNIATVPVGNPGNAADLLFGGCGSVGYTYNIGKYEVTTGQYCEFLNSVARGTDTYGLYNMSMWSDSTGCKIQRSGSPGRYTYSVPSDWANRPVNWVSWGDAARFANWMHNGQRGGDQNVNTTEDGSYFLNGATSNTALMAVTRKATATWVIPSEDEWHKAAYHKNDGVTGNYFSYPTSSSIMPDSVLGHPADPGNNATFFGNNGYTIGSPYWRTEVGAHENSDSPYGTFDQGGNVWEWTDDVLYGSYRGRRGGSFADEGLNLRAAYRVYDSPSHEYELAGFRVVEVPEPASIVLVAFVSLGMVGRRR
jgi:formylglycine-generating enzyme